MKKRLGSDSIKYLAIFAMLLDHIAWVFLPFSSPVSQVFHFFGRITAPIMCFFIAEGFRHTKNVKRYLLRLFVFALVSQFPWCLMHSQSLEKPSFNMMFTLFFSLLAIYAAESFSSVFLKCAAVFLCAVLTLWCDWQLFAVLWSVSFYYYGSNGKKLFASFSAISLMYTAWLVYQNSAVGNSFSVSLLSSFFSLGTFLSLPLIIAYDETKRPNKFSRLVFYLFYPLHMLVLGLLKA